MQETPPAASARATLPRVGAALLLIGWLSAPAPSRSAAQSPPPIVWPEGTDTLAFENVEGIILIRARLTGRPVGAERSQPRPVPTTVVDTTGWLAFDTGAGFIALDARVAVRLGVLDRVPSRAVDFAERTLPRLEMGKLQADQLSPVAVFDAGLLARVTDHAVLGLLGYAVVRDRIVWIDYAAQRIVLIPAGVEVVENDALAVAASRRIMGNALSAAAVPCRFRMTLDGKIMLRGRVTPNHGGKETTWLNLVLDTGASKSTLFEDLIDTKSNVAGWRPALKGLSAPTLLATSSARLCRVRRIEVQGTSVTASAAQTEVALLKNPIAAELGRLAGEPVHGLLGYTFLERFHVAVDYPRRVLWLDPISDYRDPRPYEHSHVGLQLERDRGAVRVVAVVEDSPAAEAGIAPGDEVTAVGGKTLAGLSWAEVSRILEGPAGSELQLTVRHDGVEKTHRLRRRQLL